MMDEENLDEVDLDPGNKSRVGGSGDSDESDDSDDSSDEEDGDEHKNNNQRNGQDASSAGSKNLMLFDVLNRPTTISATALC